MSLKIKLSKVGKKNDPKFRIIVAETRSKRDGKYVDKIGFYDPILDPFKLDINEEKLRGWISKGAQLSDGVHKLLKNRIKLHG